MTFVQQSRVFPRSLWRPALFFFALSQFLFAFAPLAEGRSGESAKAHVESGGTQSHHAHNGEDCAACTARTILSGALPISVAGLQLFPVIATESFDDPEIEGSQSVAAARPRAPPVRQA